MSAAQATQLLLGGPLASDSKFSHAADLASFLSVEPAGSAKAKGNAKGKAKGTGDNYRRMPTEPIECAKALMEKILTQAANANKFTTQLGNDDLAKGIKDHMISHESSLKSLYWEFKEKVVVEKCNDKAVYSPLDRRAEELFTWYEETGQPVAQSFCNKLKPKQVTNKMPSEEPGKDDRTTAIPMPMRKAANKKGKRDA